MKFNEIIEELFFSNELDSCIAKMVREDLRADFKQELFVIILNQDKTKIEEINDRGQLRYFVVRIVINLVSQTRNVFHKQYLNKTVSHPEDVRDDYDRELVMEKEIRHENALRKISQMDEHFNTFYYRALTELVKRHGSMNKAAKASGIPLTTISNGFKKIRSHLKEAVDV